MNRRPASTSVGFRAAVVAISMLVIAVIPESGSAQPSGRVPLAQFEPLPPASQVDVSPEARALRAQLLGPHHDDPGYATLHWYGVASYIFTFKGHLLLLDAWEIIGLHADYAPIGREELAALEPEAILIGHGHFDHAADAGYVAGRTGAVVVGSEEICDVAKEDAAAEGLDDEFICAITGTMEDPLPGTTQAFRLFDDVEPVTVLQHVHSAATQPSEANQPDPFIPVFDPVPYITHLNSDPAALAVFLETLGDAQGGTWMYHFRDGDFTLLWGDSSGPIFDFPDVRAALDSFPRCVDVMTNAILGFDQPVSGLQDPRLYVENAHPKVFLPTHADAWAPVISAGQSQYEEEWSSQMAQLENPPEVDFLKDPGDYLVERAYSLSDSRWVEPMPGSSCVSAASAPPEPAPVNEAVADESEELPVTGGVLGLVGLVLIAVASMRRR